jgi:hypothetical protein
VKPQNVMLMDDGTVKVLDFGVATVLDPSLPRLTKSGEAIGTPAYMSPEQLHSLPATPRTDLYALGCLLYEMLAGEPVFSSTSPAGLMRMHLEQAPAPLRRHDMHPDLDMLVRQLLEKDPARRPADAREAYDRLLAHVVRPGPLGNVDPVAAGQTGMHRYSRVLVRLSGAAGPRSAGFAGFAGFSGPGSSGPGFAEPDFAGPGFAGPGFAGPPPYGPSSVPPAVRRSTRERVVHSLWMLPILFFGLGTWLSFAYIAARYRRLSWLLAAVAYLVLMVGAFALIGSGPEDNADTPQTTIGMVIGLVTWAAGLIHALWINETIRSRRVTS